MIKNKNRGGFIDRQRKAVAVGEEENSSLFFFLALRARPSALAEKKNKTTSVYRLKFKQIQTDNKHINVPVTWLTAWLYNTTL